MKKQAYNPYLPSYEYIPDGEPHIFGDRVYVYGSHDKFNGLNFCLGDYVCWSAPVDDLSDWRYEGVIFRREQEPDIKNGKHMNMGMAAPDVCQGADGKYYLYYFIGGNGLISVAVCDTPAGKYQYVGPVHYEDGTPIGHRDEPLQFDPGVFRDDDGRVFLFSGFGLGDNPFLLSGRQPSLHGPMCFELCEDMLTVKAGPKFIGVKGEAESVGTPYEGHAFLEASSLRKFDGKYYFIYSSLESHELCYATCDTPDGTYEYGGVLISNGDIGYEGRAKKDALNYTGNTHGSLIKIKDKYYVFYHRQTNRKQFSRQACAEEIQFKDGKFHQAELTSCGLNGGPLRGRGIYPARIACNLMSRKGTRFYWALKGPKGCHPYFTQTGKDREDHPAQYIANMCEGATAGFKYFDLKNLHSVSVCIGGYAQGVVVVSTSLSEEDAIAKIPVWVRGNKVEFQVSTKSITGVKPLYFTFHGVGSFDFLYFTLNK